MRNLIWNALLTMLLTAACEDWQPDDVYFDPSQTSDAISTCTDNHLRPQYYFPKIIFQGGTEGYEHYRIPSIIRAKNGNLIAIAEGRKFSEDDYGDIDVVYKISYDNGENFGPLKLLFSKWDGTCGNPTPVLDWDTGAIWIFMSYNEAGYSQFGDEGTTEITEWGQRRVYSKVSRDNGETWGELVNRTTDLLPKGQAWDAMGPGNGIQLDSGRLVIPAINRNIYSDDHGATWDYQMIRSGTSEGTIVQLTNGDLMRNDRAASIKLKWRKRRQVSTSSDNGETWTGWQSDMALLDPLCEASILRYNESYPPRIMFFNPKSTDYRNPMVVRISYDEGQTWPIERTVDTSHGGYSSMTKTADYMIGSLAEIGIFNGHYSIKFRKFNIPWILNGTPEPCP